MGAPSRSHSREGGNPLRKPTRDLGSDVICQRWELQAALIPAKAGIHAANLRNPGLDELDSRFRGNGRCFERDPIPNDTTTRAAVLS
jgi:hypothetical protein